MSEPQMTKEHLDIGEASLLASFSSSQVGKAEFIKKVFALAREGLRLREAAMGQLSDIGRIAAIDSAMRKESK